MKGKRIWTTRSKISVRVRFARVGRDALDGRCCAKKTLNVNCLLTHQHIDVGRKRALCKSSLVGRVDANGHKNTELD